SSPPSPPPDPDAELLVEIEQLREHVTGFASEREALLAHAVKLAAELDRSREEKARTDAELHVARQRIEALQQQQLREDSRAMPLSSLTAGAELSGEL